MRSAPAVRIEAGQDPLWQRAMAVLAASAAAATAAWTVLQAGGGPGVSAGVSLASAALGAWVSRRVLGSDPGTLQWDTQTWTWAGAGRAGPAQAGEVQVVIDLGPWMLLRFRAAAPGRGTAWIAVSQRRAAAAWHAWRTAVYSRRPEPEGDAAPRF